MAALAAEFVAVGRRRYAVRQLGPPAAVIVADLADLQDMTASARRIQAPRRVIAAAILAAGLGSALVISLTATPAPPNPLGYEPEDSKQYLRQMEVYGGKSNVLASEFRQWFDSLWHGRRLAATVVCLTFVFLLVFLVGSTPLPPDVVASSHGEQKPDRSGS